jgi:hypothetical protein
MHHNHSRFSKLFLVFEIWIFMGSLLEWVHSSDTKCVSVTEENDYLCLSGSRNAVQSRIDYDTVHFGIHQQVQGSDDERKKTTQIIEDTYLYYIEEVSTYTSNVRSICRNENELCSFWASREECEKNRLYMIQTCPLACRMCLARYVQDKYSSMH